MTAFRFLTSGGHLANLSPSASEGPSPNWTTGAQSNAASLRALLFSLLTWPVDFVRDFFGPCEFSIGEVRGHQLALCANGCRDVHDVDEPCPREVLGLCVECNRERSLDRFGNCPLGHRSIVRRRMAVQPRKEVMRVVR
ncbi:MAG TPA: hypothetical protein VNL91_09130 [Thermoanaerobaculia bacterium]|nr:hypothetical protein [Thermoanaerobaculia bacterium]